MRHLVAIPVLGFFVFVLSCECIQKNYVSGEEGYTVTVKRLRCEYLKNPLGIDLLKPRLSWEIVSKRRGCRQTSYRILVAGSREKLAGNKGNLWDSGKVKSDQTVHVVYGGNRLSSRQWCWWKVKIWDEGDEPSAWSEPGRWSMGLLSSRDWKAEWIGYDGEFEPADKKPSKAGVLGREKKGQYSMDPLEERVLPARMLRKEFIINKKVKRGVVFVSGLGLFELYLNGEKEGNRVLDPALTEYNKRAFYVTFDVTEKLKEGNNALGIILGNGRFYAPRRKIPTRTITFGYPKMILQLSIDYADGSTALIKSDKTWKLTTHGPIRSNNEYDGEIYDARLERPGWNKVGFDDSKWMDVQLVKSPGGKIVSQMCEPVRVIETLNPKSITNPEPGVYVFDMGQNIAGWPLLKVEGPCNTRVTMKCAESLRSNGLLYTANLRSARARDIYILKGKEVETYEPRFTYHGFRYVALRGFPGKPDLKSICCCVVHDDLEPAGSFSCSNKLLNRIHKNILWGTKDNYRTIPTDCTQRDERQGWLGDRSSESKGETFLFNVAAFYSKWMDDIRTAQRGKGEIPDVAPPYWPFYSNNVTWPSSYIIIPGHLYDHYGDRRVLERNYPAMKKWLDFMTGFLDGYIMLRDQYGDWCVPPDSPKIIHSNDPGKKTAKGILGTAYFYHDLKLMAEYAVLLGKTKDSKRFNTLAARMKESFNKKYFKPELAQYDNGSQTSSVLPLAFRMVPEGREKQVFERLVKKIEVESKGHIGVGLIGCQWLMRTLSDYGRPDLAYRIANQKSYPSWGYMIENNATTIWELWNGNTANPAMNSGNHLMLIGDLNTWFYEYLAGIRPDHSSPGFKRIIIKPVPAGDLTFARATYRSIHGMIKSGWRIEGNRFYLNILIPANCNARVYIPAIGPGSVSESGINPAADSIAVEFLRMESGRAVFSVGSGEFEFVSDLKTRTSRFQDSSILDRVDKTIKGFMKRYDVPGLSIAVAKNGRIVFAKGYGVANKETSERVTTSHRFRIASISKPVTAVAIMKLVEEGRLSLDEYVFGDKGILGKQYKTTCAFIKQVRIRHLLQHSAGKEWSNKKDDPMFLKPELNRHDLIQWTLDNKELHQPPGTEYAYSNFGFCVLGRVIETITGKPYPVYVKESILKECGAFSFDIAGDRRSQRKKDEVVYYSRDKRSAYSMQVSRMDSHGGWIATPTDLVRFVLRVDGFNPPPDILKKSTLKEMVKPSKRNKNYASGWCVNEHNNWWHMGSLPGTASVLVRTGSGLCWAVIVNTRSREETFMRDLDKLPWKIVSE